MTKQTIPESEAKKLKDITRQLAGSRFSWTVGELEEIEEKPERRS